MAEITYEPDLTRFETMLRGVAASHVLVVGPAVLEIPEAVEARQIPGIPNFPRGIFGFRRGGRGVLVYCEQGVSGAPARSNETRLEDDDPLMAGCGLYANYWNLGQLFGRTAAFSKGAVVSINGTQDIGVIVDVRHAFDSVRYGVRVGDHTETVTESSLEIASVDMTHPEAWLRMGAVGAEGLSLTLSYTKLANPLTDTIYAYLSSKTVYRPYQFKPVLKLLNSARPRLLIADEVGLGKTIEAGLIWTELEQRIGLERVLVVCPASLVFKWQDEMRRRFDRSLIRLDAAGVRELAAQFRINEPPTSFAGVVSLQSLRSAELAALLAEAHPDFDLVIVDEAHHLRNRGTLSHAIGAALADWAHALIFLSATPINLGTSDLFNLLALLDEETFSDRAIFDQQLEPNRSLNEAAQLLAQNRDNPAAVLDKLKDVENTLLGATLVRSPEYEDLCHLLGGSDRLSYRDIALARRHLASLNTLSGVVTRTRKKDVPEKTAVRSANKVDVPWTTAERDLYTAVLKWARHKALASGGVVGFATVMPLRQAASCLPAMKALLAEREPSLLQDRSEFEDDLADEMEALPLEDDFDWEELRSLVGAVGDSDTKFDVFLAHIEELKAHGIQQVMVFSFFRRTLGYLRDRLETLGHNVEVMHGGVKMAQREEIMKDFRARKIDILLLSEVGSEGLDFEFCNVIFNYDLPWNPMRVEQRIGRLDRFGQEHEKILIFNFHVPGTIETDIFERLYLRIKVFEESIGELEPILRGTLSDIQRLAFDAQLSDEERSLEVDRIAVALEEKDNQLDDIQQAQSFLSGLENLLIDGLQETQARGGFIGPPELKRVLTEMIGDGTRSKLKVDKDGRRGILVGDEELADRLTRYVRDAAGSSYRIQQLANLLRDQSPLQITFDNEDASRNGLELISLRHPLIRASIEYLRGMPTHLSRFGCVALPDEKQRSFAVLFYLVRTTGFRPSLELTPVSIDLETLEVEEGVGQSVLSALAQGVLLDTDKVIDEGRVREAFALAEERMSSLQRAIEERRRRANAAFVDARLVSLRASVEGKIARDASILEELEGRNAALSITRLYRGKIDNARRRLRQDELDLEEKRQLAVTHWPVAAAVVQPAPD